MCRAIFCTDTGTTSGMLRHLKKSHPELFDGTELKDVGIKEEATEPQDDAEADADYEAANSDLSEYDSSDEEYNTYKGHNKQPKF